MYLPGAYLHLISEAVPKYGSLHVNKKITLKIGKKCPDDINASTEKYWLISPLCLGVIFYYKEYQSCSIKLVVFKLVIIEFYFPDEILPWTLIYKRDRAVLVIFGRGQGAAHLASSLAPTRAPSNPFTSTEPWSSSVWKVLTNIQVITEAWMISQDASNMELLLASWLHAVWHLATQYHLGNTCPLFLNRKQTFKLLWPRM